MGKIMIIKGVDFSKNALTKIVPSDIPTWDVVVPSTPFIADNFTDNVRKNYCFSDASQVFDGNKGFSVVKIIMRGKANIDNLDVYLLEVDGYDTEPTTQVAHLVSMLGTINHVKDEDTIARFALPSLDATKKYIVGVFTKESKFFLVNSTKVGVTAYTIFANDNNNYFSVEPYNPSNGSRGAYVFAYYQIMYK